ncbi:GTPase Der-like isoform X1 [Gossypium australe]|uniref:GTPase Der n=1 Tax=Gossypium australe TaxID=47621 RepID=A0A5B6VS74_9ROSI|nr:GTPase Der-like isoform X1 [Gossypium australe]
MNGNRYGFRSTAAAAAAREYIRRHHRHGSGENQCSSALVKHFKAPFSLFARKGAITFPGASTRHLSSIYRFRDLLEKTKAGKEKKRPIGVYSVSKQSVAETRNEEKIHWPKSSTLLFSACCSIRPTLPPPLLVPSFHFLSVIPSLFKSYGSAHLVNNFRSSIPATLRFCTFAVSEDDVSKPNSKTLEEATLVNQKSIDFTKLDINLLPTVMIIGRPNVGKSALFNRLIRRREALVYNTPDDHVTRDIREGLAKLGDLRFRVLDSAGLETEAASGSILNRTAAMTANVLARTQFAIFLIDVRLVFIVDPLFGIVLSSLDLPLSCMCKLNFISLYFLESRTGLHPLDQEVGKWLRKHAPGINPIVAMNKSESLHKDPNSFAEAATEALKLGFGEPIAISAETGLGMTALHESLRPMLENYMAKVLDGKSSQDENLSQDNDSSKNDESKLPLQLAIVGRPNVGKSTLLNVLLQEDRVLVGPEAGLTRDSVRAQFQYQGRTVYLVYIYCFYRKVDTAGWLQRGDRHKGPNSLSVMQSRKNLMRAHIVALVLDAEEIAKARRSMTHAEVVIARQAVEEGRGLVVVVNKMDLLKGPRNSALYKRVKEAVPQEIQMVIPQITGIPVLFISAIDGRGRAAVMSQVIDAYEKWCLRLSTARLNRWLRKVASRHSWKDQGSQTKIKYFTQVKARPPTFVAFVSGNTKLSDTYVRFLTKSLKEDFDMGGIPIRIMQRSVPRMASGSSSKTGQSTGKTIERTPSDKRSVVV